MAESLLDQPEVPGPPGRLDRNCVWGKPEEAEEWRAKLPQTDAAREWDVTQKRLQFLDLQDTGIP
jgi:hypothetical protein